MRFLSRADAAHPGRPTSCGGGPASVRVLLLVLGLLMGIGLAAPAAAQDIDSTHVARFQLADSYMRAGQFDRAITLLEDLLELSPQTYAFYDKLKEAYEGVKRYDDAIALVERRMGQRPDPSLQVEKARLYYLANDEDAANEAWAAAIAMAPSNPNVYRIVYQSLYQVRLFERAIATLEEGRRAAAQPELFRRELAYLYNLTGQHEEAMEEYIGLLEENERQLGYVRSRLSRFIEQEEALNASIAAAERAVRRVPLNRAFRELTAWLYLEAELYDKALDANRAIDRLEQEEGRVLFGFAQQAADAGAYDVALDAYQEILERYPDGPIAPDALLGVGEMYTQRGERLRERALDEEGRRIEAPNYDQALATFETFLERYPTHPYYPEVLRRIGHLQQAVFFDLDAAEQTLNRVIQRYPRSQAVSEAAYDLGRIALLRGELDKARAALGRLEETLRTGELAERARYELALIHLYRGEWESAMTLAQAMQGNTSTDVANDAIELKVLLIENKGPDSLNVPLQDYAEAQLLRRQRKPLQALTVVDTLLATYGSHALADDARYLRAQMLRELGRAEEAAQAYGEIPLMHPRSFLADRSLFAMAETLAQDLGREQEAIDTYSRLLTDFPGSLLAGEARARIRLLRGDGA